MSLATKNVTFSMCVKTIYGYKSSTGTRSNRVGIFIASSLHMKIIFYLILLLSSSHLLAQDQTQQGDSIQVSDFQDIAELVNAMTVGQETKGFEQLKNKMGVVKGIATGNEYLAHPDESGKVRLIPMEFAEIDHIKDALIQKIGGVKGPFKRSALRIRGEYPRFQVAMSVVLGSACFGGSLLAGLPLNARVGDPTCVENFMHSLTDIHGLIGFYFFMVANDASSKVMANSLVSVMHFVDKKTGLINFKSTPATMAKIMPFIGYMGMVFGSMASEIYHHLAVSPNMGACLSYISRLNYSRGSVDCKQLASHLLSADHFWHDFAAGVPALVGSAALATVTQKALKNVTHKTSSFSKPVAKPLFNSMYYGATYMSGSIKNLSGIKKITKVQVLQNMVRHKGKLGAAVRITGSTIGVASIGHMILFFAWDHILRPPSTKLYWHRTNAKGLFGNGGIKRSLKEFDRYISEMLKDPLKPYLSFTKPVYCGRGKKICKESKKYVIPLKKTLKKFDKVSTRYREKVTLNGFEEGVYGWKSKWKSVLEEYIIAKSIVEKVIGLKKKRKNFSLSTSTVAQYISSLWLQSKALDHPKMRGAIQHLQLLVNTFYVYRHNYLVIQSEQSKLGHLGQATAALQKKRLDSAFETLVFIQKEMAITMLDLKELALKYYPSAYSGNCRQLGADSDYATCLAAMETLHLPRTPYHQFEVRSHELIDHVEFIRSFQPEPHSDKIHSPLHKVLGNFICRGSLNQQANYRHRLLIDNRNGSSASVKFPSIITKQTAEQIEDMCEHQRDLHFSIPIAKVITTNVKELAKSNSLVQDNIEDSVDQIYKELGDEGVSDLEKLLGADLKSIIKEKVENQSVAVDIVPNRLWVTPYGIYTDPISFLADKDVDLNINASVHRSEQWWNDKVVPELIDFYAFVLDGYYTHLDHKVFSAMDYSPAAQLIDERPANKFESIYKYMVRTNRWFFGQRMDVNALFIGKMKVLTLSLSKLIPFFLSNAAPLEARDKREKIQKILDTIQLNFAEHSRSIKLSSTRENMKSEISEFVRKLKSGSKTTLDMQNRFRDMKFDMKSRLYGNNLELHSARVEELKSLVDQLTVEVYGKKYRDLKASEKDEINSTGYRTYVALNPEKYQKYIALLTINEINDLIDEMNAFLNSYIYTEEIFHF